MGDEKHTPRTCPLAPDREDLIDAFAGAIRQTKPEWDNHVGSWVKVFGVLIVGAIFWAGYNLAQLRGELTLGSRERAAIVASTTRLAQIVERLDERLDKAEQEVSRMNGQRDGWRQRRSEER